MGDKTKLSVILVVRNEEKNIRKCIGSVRWADDIIVVDQSSTDRTVEIARSYTDRIFQTEMKFMCEPDRKFAEEKMRYEWGLYLDADEIVTSQLADEIKSVIADPRFDVYYMPRKNYFLGRWIKHCGWYPGYVPRLFRKGRIKFADKVHRDNVPLGPAGYLKNDLIHNSYESMDQYFEKFNRYTALLAQDEYDRGVRVRWYNSLWLILIKPLAYLLDKYFRKAGLMDGVRGLLISWLTFLTVMMQYIKLWDLQNRDGEAGSHDESAYEER